MGVKLGMNARIFPANWRPIREEIAFASSVGFRALQFARRGEALNETILDDAFDRVRDLLTEADIAPVMEIMVFVGQNGKTIDNTTPLDALRANLIAIRELEIKRVHWHIVPKETVAGESARRLEARLYPQLSEAVSIADSEGFIFGLEHNEPRLNLFACASSMAAALETIAGLHFVWDTNHTSDQERVTFKLLLPRASLIHIADTPLPQLNYHLPIGQGNTDFSDIFASLNAHHFNGPAILEIGGTPQSGGYGKDSDEALQDSLARLEYTRHVSLSTDSA